VLTDSVDPDRTERAWASAKEHLLRDMGPLLLAPAYEEPDATIGYITRYAPGLRENGGVYMHAATWALGAACKKKDVEAVGRIWRAISPPGRAAADAESYRAEPYVMPGNVDGPQSQYPGRAGWTWYTGSAAWLNRVCLEWVLGIRPVWGEGREPGLLIDPCPWPGLGKVDVTRVWRGRKVRVRFDAGGWRAKEPAALVVNGAAVGSNVLIASDHEKGGSIDVEVRWGSSENGIKTRPVRDRVGAVERNPR
jgi:cellobiose phosphorylase